MYISEARGCHEKMDPKPVRKKGFAVVVTVETLAFLYDGNWGALDVRVRGM
jgi:hypothetical protein